MAKEQKVLNPIPALYKHSSLNVMLFAYIRGVQSALHTITIRKAIDMFMAEFNLNHDEFNIDSAIVTYHRLNKSAFSYKQNKNHER